MDDMIYRNDPIAEENIDPHGRPATDEFEEWSEEVSERTDTGYKDQKVKSAREREKRIREMDEIIKKDLKQSPLIHRFSQIIPLYLISGLPICENSA